MTKPEIAPMRVYVATAFKNIPEARAVIQLLRGVGHDITHDWTNETLEGIPAAQQSAYLDRCGASDYRGVMTADAVVLICHPDMRDARVEWGMALGRGIPSVVVYPDRLPSRSVFENMPGVRKVGSLPELLDALQILVARG